MCGYSAISQKVSEKEKGSPEHVVKILIKEDKTVISSQGGQERGGAEDKKMLNKLIHWLLVDLEITHPTFLFPNMMS